MPGPIRRPNEDPEGFDGPRLWGNSLNVTRRDQRLMHMRKFLPIAAVALGLVSGASADRPSEDLLAALDHAEFAERERATRAMVEAVDGSLRRLESMIAGVEMNAEQRARVEAIGWELFRRGERAGMGVSFDFDRATAGVRINSTVPGFHAADVLAPGDVILEMDGHELDSIDTMRFLIVARDPGDELRLKVERQGRTIGTTVRMGSFAQLNQGTSQIDIDVLDGAWRYRLARWESPSQTTADAVLDGPPPPRYDSARRSGFARWFAEGVPNAPRLSAGGEPTGGVAPCGRLRVRFDGSDLLMPPVRLGIDGLRENQPGPVVQTVRDELHEVSAILSSEQRELRERLIGSDEETRERITEAMARVQERTQRVNNRANELYELLERAYRGQR